MLKLVIQSKAEMLPANLHRYHLVMDGHAPFSSFERRGDPANIAGPCTRQPGIDVYGDY